jgi:hypothetical protein
MTYDAFISYGHGADSRLAAELQTSLQRFAKPWWRRRALRVFRDETGLSANPHLWSAIETALGESDWLVLLASPQSAASKWVGREISWWIQHRDPNRILPVVTDGYLAWDQLTDRLDAAASTAVPPVLAGAFVAEPRWVDLRWARAEADLNLRDSRFRGVVADLAAPLRGVAKDELESEELRQHRRTVRTAIAGVAMLAVLFVAATIAGVAAVGQRNQAQGQRAEAERQRIEAERQTVIAEETATSERNQRLVAQARQLAGTRIDLALLLAVEASVREPGARTDQALIEVLAAARSIQRVVPMSQSGMSALTLSSSSSDTVWTFAQDRRSLIPTEMNNGAIGTPVAVREGATAVAELDGGRLLAVAYTDGSIDLVDPVDDRVLHTRRHTYSESEIVALEDGRQLAVRSGRAEVTFLSVPELDVIARVDIQEVGDEILNMLIGHGDQLLVETVLGQLVALSTQGVEAVVTLGDGVTSIAEDAASGSLALATFRTGSVFLVDLDRSELVEVVDFQQNTIATSLRFADNGRLLFVGREDGAILRFDLRAPQTQVTPLAILGGPVTALDPESSESALQALTATAWYRIDLAQTVPFASPVRSPRGPEDYTDALAISADQVAVGRQPGQIEIRSLDSGALIRTVEVGQNGTIPALASTPGGWVASLVEFPGIDLRLLRQAQQSVSASTQQALTADLAEPLQDSFLVGLRDDGSETWRLAVPQPIVGLVTLDDGVIAALDVDATLIAVDSNDGQVRARMDVVIAGQSIFLDGAGSELVVGGCVAELVHLRWIDDAFVHEGSLPRACWPTYTDGTVVFSDEQGRARIADIESLTSRVVGDSNYSNGAWLLEDSPYLLQFVGMGDVDVRDVSTGDRVALLRAMHRPDVVVWAEPTPGGGAVVLASNGALARWSFDRNELRLEACAIVGRDLTDEEWTTYLSSDPFRSTCAAVDAPP